MPYGATHHNMCRVSLCVCSSATHYFTKHLMSGPMSSPLRMAPRSAAETEDVGLGQTCVEKASIEERYPDLQGLVRWHKAVEDDLFK